MSMINMFFIVDVVKLAILCIDLFKVAHPIIPRARLRGSLLVRARIGILPKR